MVHSLWTLDGSDISGLAPVLLSGQVDLLGIYVTFQDDEGDSIISDNTIDRIHCKNLSYDDFASKYMHANVPVIIQGLTDDWKASTLWTHERDGKVVPNLDYFRDNFGEDVVPVHEQLRAGFAVTRPVSRDMTVSDYSEWWSEHHQELTKREGSEDNSLGVDAGSDDTLLYLKDWKFLASHSSYGAYEWPHFFRDDWLNQSMRHAYKFVYLGPKGTSTVLHADVLRSFSWSTNVCGRKRWYLIPPEYTYLLYDCFGTLLASHLHAEGTFFPGLRSARRHAMEVDQKAGETIFVPSKWYHSVENLEPTLSINHNWLNRANIVFSWTKLKSELNALPSEDGSSKQQVTKRATSADTSSNDSSQVGDDFVLLWHVVSKKAWSHLGEEECTAQGVLDLSAILPILTEMQFFMNDDDGNKTGLVESDDCDVSGLVESILACLERQANNDL